MKAVYFASVRERIGRSEEILSPPAEVRTVGDLLAWLRSRDDVYGAAFAQSEAIRAALDHQHVRHETPLAGAREIAFFPPMTGG
jgi:molybdopterin synthase sulfur carrier subunit